MAALPQGLEKLLRQVEALPTLQVKAAGDSLKQNAEELAASIRRVAPRDTGDMAEKIKASPVTTNSEGGAHVKGGLGLAWKVSAPFPGRFVEFGTKAGERHHATKAEPFFWVIVHAYRKKMRSRLGRNSRKAAKQAARVS